MELIEISDKVKIVIYIKLVKDFVNNVISRFD